MSCTAVSSSSVVTPGTTSGATRSRMSATSRPGRAHAGEVLGAWMRMPSLFRRPGRIPSKAGSPEVIGSACSVFDPCHCKPARRPQPAFFQTVVRPAPPAGDRGDAGVEVDARAAALSASSSPLGARGAERDGQPGAVLGGDHPGVRRGRRHVRPGDDLDPHHRRQVDEAALRAARGRRCAPRRSPPRPRPSRRRCSRSRRIAARSSPRPAAASEQPEHERQRRQRAVAAPGEPEPRSRAAPPRRIGSRQRRRRAASSGRRKLIASPRASPARASAPPPRRCRRAAPAARASPAVTNGRPRSRSASSGAKPPSGPISTAQGPGSAAAQRLGRRRRRALLVAEHQPPRRVPAVEQRREPHRLGELGHVGLAALLGRLDRVRPQPVGAQPLGAGQPGEDRLDARGAELGRLLDDEVGARLLDRREEQPEVGRPALRPARLAGDERAAAPAGLGRPRPTIRRRGR